MNRFSPFALTALAVANSLFISAPLAPAQGSNQKLIAKKNEDEPRPENKGARPPQPGRSEAVMQRPPAQQMQQRAAQEQQQRGAAQQQRQAQEQAQEQAQRQAQQLDRETRRNQDLQLKQEQKLQENQAREAAKMQQEQARQEQKVQQEQARQSQRFGYQAPGGGGIPPTGAGLQPDKFRNPANNGFGQPALREQERLPKFERKAFVQPGEEVHWKGNQGQPIANPNGWRNRPAPPPLPVRSFAPLQTAAPPPR